MNALAESRGVHLVGLLESDDDAERREAVASSKAALARGARVVAWTSAAAVSLSAGRVEHTTALEALGDDPEMTLYRASADWTRAFGVRATVEGVPLLDALAYQGTTLWWWAELYLHHNTDAIRHVRVIEQAARVLDSAVGPVTEFGLPEDDETLVARLCATRGLVAQDLEEGGLTVSSPSWLRTAIDAAKVFGTAAKAARGGAPGAPPEAIVFLSHAAFWKTRTSENGEPERYEHYLDAVLRATRDRRWPVAILGVGPKDTHRTRTGVSSWRERLGSSPDDVDTHANAFVSARIARETWGTFVRMRSIATRARRAESTIAALSHRGVSFADGAQGDVARTLTHQCVWAARSIGEFDAAFRALRPRAVCLYAETSGLGRAAVVAAKALGIPSMGVQHGILYPNYFSMERTDDDVRRGTPIPDRTAVYGREGVKLLEEEFRYPPGRVVATGAPQFDALAAASRTFDRSSARARFGLRDGQRLVVLASRYRGIRETHKASGPAFSGLLAALGRIEDVRLIVKPHPAEPVDAYDADIRRSAAPDRIAVISDVGLSDLLAAADALVTVESLSATEAIVANVPTVILRHPSNLRGLVESGAALGVPDGSDPGATLRSILFDAAAIEDWRRRRVAFLEDAACGVDGRSAERLAAALGELAGLAAPTT